MKCQHILDGYSVEFHEQVQQKNGIINWIIISNLNLKHEVTLVYIKNFSNVVLINLLYLGKLINELQTRGANNPPHA